MEFFERIKERYFFNLSRKATNLIEIQVSEVERIKILHKFLTKLVGWYALEYVTMYKHLVVPSIKYLEEYWDSILCDIKYCSDRWNDHRIVLIYMKLHEVIKYVEQKMKLKIFLLNGGKVRVQNEYGI